MYSETVQLIEAPNGDLVLPLSDEVLSRLGWSEGTSIEWVDNQDGTYTMKAILPTVATEKVLVETVQLTRIQYTVDVPVGKSVWALDAVVMKEATVLSSEYLDETIVSHRTITPAEFEQLSKGSDEQ